MCQLFTRWGHRAMDIQMKKPLHVSKDNNNKYNNNMCTPHSRLQNPFTCIVICSPHDN